MSRSALDRRLRDELRAARPPHAADAERRAWEVVRAAHAERTPFPRHRRLPRLALAVAAAIAAGALALTPAGAKVGDWIDDVVSPAPHATRSTLSSLPTDGRLLVLADGAPWVVRDDGARRRLGSFRDASWSPGGLYVVAARGRELVALDPQGHERWALPTPGPVSMPRWSPGYGYRIAYRSARDLYVTTGDNTRRWLLARVTRPVPPAWKPVPAAADQVLAFAVGGRVRIEESDPPGRVLGETPPEHAPREIWWADGGRRLVTVTSRAVLVHGSRGRLLRTVRLPRGTIAAGSAMAPDGRRLAVAVRRPSPGASELLVVRVDRRPRMRSLLSLQAPFEGLTWSIDGTVLVLGLPASDQWLFLRPRRPLGFEAVKRIREQFAGGHEPRTGSFPRPAGWCHPEPASPTPSGEPACSAGSAP